MNKKVKTFVSSALIGGMLLTTGSIVFADSNSTGNSDGQKPVTEQAGEMAPGRKGGQAGFGLFDPAGRGDRAGGQYNIDELTKDLVEQGIITQETADKLTSFMDEKDAERKTEMEKLQNMTEEERKAYLENKKSSETDTKSDFWSEAVDEGILTQEQVDSIKAYIEKQAETQRQQQQKEELDNLVSAGLITQEQEEKIIEYYNNQEEARKAEMEKIKDMTEEERKAYLESKKDTKPEDGTSVTPLQKLVDDGTLTQDQAQAVVKALFPNVEKNTSN